MKYCILSIFAVTAYLVPAQTQLGARFVANCNNEDFESSSPSGIITNSSSISGWNIFKLSYSVSNCAALTSTAVTKLNPTASRIYTVNGLVDSIIGSGYPIYSVFGSGSPNGGTTYNPEISDMLGNSFLKLGTAAYLPTNNHHSIEKTINVTTANCLFRFAYISVVEKGSICCSSPAVQVRFYNTSQGGVILPCPVYSVSAPTQFCANPNTPPLIASATATETFYHKWQIEAVDLSPYIGNVITFKMTASYCSNSGCPKYSYAYLDAQCGPMEILVNGTPFPAHTNSVNISACGVTNATVVAPPDFSSYQWSGPSGFTSTLSTITTSLAGTYTLNINTSGTCTTLTKYVNINLFPAPNLSLTTTNTLLCKGNSATLTATGLNTYTWNTQSGPSIYTVNPTNTTTYNVTGHDNNGCFASATIIQSVSPCTGISTISSLSPNIKIYPNPNDGSFNLFIDEVGSSASLCLINVLGQTVFCQNIRAGINNIEANAVTSGLYYCTIRVSDKSVTTVKLQIQ